ncbi:hypothetical protein GOB94_08720 [Granulicella sp. 5B5]|uniref:hypothetical protein n=1 Tax=Granulicella sp. 5B5 TaxID=1617967 RepID=UPI0015F6C7D4|nr:hypothetical protein [Granulicella sp. 5B5]QMV18756.1 hypothetical protein GOB94_08720 [Granulicella sp. 5B5]
MWPTIVFLVSLQLSLPLACASGQSVKPDAADSASQSEIVFTLRNDMTNAPIQVVGISIEGKKVSFGTPVRLTGNWLGKIRVDVKNISPKELVYGTLTVWFPETGDGTSQHPYMTSAISLGRRPLVAFRRKDGTLAPIPSAIEKQVEVSFLPGSTMSFQVEPERASYEQQQVYSAADEITKAELRFSSFYFADGTQWTGGTYFAPVPPPQVWKEITPAEFNAHSTAN